MAYADSMREVLAKVGDQKRGQWSGRCYDGGGMQPRGGRTAKTGLCLLLFTRNSSGAAFVILYAAAEAAASPSVPSPSPSPSF